MWHGFTRHRPVCERSREEGFPVPSPQARKSVIDANRLSPEAAVALSRSIRAKALLPMLPDSTDAMRADRDQR